MATIRPDWKSPEPPASCPEAVRAYYCDDGSLWLHWVNPATGEYVEGSDVSWPWVEDYAKNTDAEALGFVDVEELPFEE